MLIASLVLPLSLAVLLMGEPVMRFFYRGTQYEGYGYTLTVLVLVVFAESSHHTGIDFTGGHEAPSRDRYNSCGRSSSYSNSCLHIDRRMGSIGCGLWVPGRSRGRWDCALADVPHTRCKKQRPGLVMRALKILRDPLIAGIGKSHELGDGVDAETFLVQSNGPPILHGHSFSCGQALQTSGKPPSSRWCKPNSTRFRICTPRCMAATSMAG